MKKAKEFMDEFIETWRNMEKYQDVKLNPVEPNYDDFEKAFSEEKKIVLICEENKEIERQNSKRLTWEKGIKVEGLPILTIEDGLVKQKSQVRGNKKLMPSLIQMQIDDSKMKEKKCQSM